MPFRSVRSCTDRKHPGNLESVGKGRVGIYQALEGLRFHAASAIGVDSTKVASCDEDALTKILDDRVKHTEDGNHTGTSIYKCT